MHTQERTAARQRPIAESLAISQTERAQRAVAMRRAGDAGNCGVNVRSSESDGCIEREIFIDEHAPVRREGVTAAIQLTARKIEVGRVVIECGSDTEHNVVAECVIGAGEINIDSARRTQWRVVETDIAMRI